MQPEGLVERLEQRRQRIGRLGRAGSLRRQANFLLEVHAAPAIEPDAAVVSQHGDELRHGHPVERGNIGQPVAESRDRLVSLRAVGQGQAGELPPRLGRRRRRLRQRRHCAERDGGRGEQRQQQLPRPDGRMPCVRDEVSSHCSAWSCHVHPGLLPKSRGRLAPMSPGLGRASYRRTARRGIVREDERRRSGRPFRTATLGAGHRRRPESARLLVDAYEPRGRGFESCRARQSFKGLQRCKPFFFGATVPSNQEVVAFRGFARAGIFKGLQRDEPIEVEPLCRNDWARTKGSYVRHWLGEASED